MTAGSTLGIAGTGLIGGSIGMRARELGWHVLGYDADESAAAQALRHGAVDEVVESDALAERADVIVIAAHVQGTLAQLERLKAKPPKRARLVLDISSVKAPIVLAAQGVANFVASHPMAGAEHSGAAAASPAIFERKPWLFVRSGDAQLDERAVTFIAAFGALPVAVDADKHDRTVAFTSHLPQVLATLFAGRLRRHDAVEAVDPFCGPTARELLRLSRSSLAMWRDILLINSQNVAHELRALAGDLEEAACALEAQSSAYIDDAFTRAQKPPLT